MEGRWLAAFDCNTDVYIYTYRMIYMFIDTGLKGRVCGATKKAVFVLSTHTSLWCEHAAVRSVLNMWLEETKNETKTMATESLQRRKTY